MCVYVCVISAFGTGSSWLFKSCVRVCVLQGNDGGGKVP